MLLTKEKEPGVNERRKTGITTVMDMKVFLLLLIFMQAFAITHFPPAKKYKRQEVEITEKEGLVRMIETFYVASPGEDTEQVDMIVTPDDAGYKIYSMMPFITFYLTWMSIFL